mgnify:CR=1 FL=1
MSINNVSFIGLGVMGYPMAGHLQKNGYNVTVFNRTETKSEKWISEFKGQMAKTPGDASKDAEIVFMCVGRDEDIIEVMEGENGIITKIKDKSIIVDHTTASAEIARKYSEELKPKNIGFLDAPISGGQAGAENAALSIMIGGEVQHYEIVKPVLKSYGKAIELIGSSGSGQIAKMINQICIAGLVQGLSEGINFGMKAGLNMEDVIEVISKGAAQSWQMENRYKTMIDDKFDFGFAVDWMRKDLKIAMDEAKNNGSLLPVTELVDKFYGEVQGLGGNRWDTSSLIKRFRK